mmetsp:Transcript_13589/g.29549  ORF Transcript_13589/g.29549 Transcript_13589/m.29549 type:complete len:220 (-) Transcript_13589:94-753(-)
MLLEAVNSVFLTFLATEYLLNNNEDPLPIASSSSSKHNSRHDRNSVFRHYLDLSATFISSQHSRPLRYTFIVVLAINFFVHFHAWGAALAAAIHTKVETLFRIPRILVAIFTFLLALYWDCRQKYNVNNKKSTSPAPWSNRYFFRQLLQSFCRLLPIYPFLAVVISFVFLFVISAFERLRLPLQILNMPIYYGTLYGPLMMMYWDVKKTVARSGSVLPR